MAQEEAYGSALGDVTAYRITDNRLEMADEEGNTVLVFRDRQQQSMNPADLAGTRWRLRSVGGDNLAPYTDITLAFPKAGELSGSAGCVAYSGTYDAEGNDLHVTMLSADYDRCGEDAMLHGQEAAYSDYLSTATDYQLSATELRLFTAPGATLVFEAQP